MFQTDFLDKTYQKRARNNGTHRTDTRVLVPCVFTNTLHNHIV